MTNRVEARYHNTGLFTASEQQTIQYYQDLLVSDQVYVGDRPFFSHEAKVLLQVEGIDPFQRGCKVELGSVWGFYNIGRLNHNEDLDTLAQEIGIQPGKRGKKVLTPRQKFEIYTRALLMCFPEESLGQ